MLEPTELTCVPGLSHSKRTTGSCAAVVAWTTSAPRTASSNSPRPATRTSAKSRARGNISCAERDCTPVPRIASTRASGRIAPAHNPDTLSEVEYYRQIFWSSGVDLPETGRALPSSLVDSIELAPGEKAVLSVQLPSHRHQGHTARNSSTSKAI